MSKLWPGYPRWQCLHGYYQGIRIFFFFFFFVGMGSTRGMPSGRLLESKRQATPGALNSTSLDVHHNSKIRVLGTLNSTPLRAKDPSKIGPQIARLISTLRASNRSMLNASSPGYQGLSECSALCLCRKMLAGGHQAIFGLEIAIHNIAVVEMLYGQHQPGDLKLGPLFAETAFLLQMPEDFASRHVVRDQEKIARCGRARRCIGSRERPGPATVSKAAARGLWG